jgi:hypothetical protein
MPVGYPKAEFRGVWYDFSGKIVMPGPATANSKVLVGSATHDQ